MPRRVLPLLSPSVTMRSTVLGFFLGSIVLVPRAITLPSASIAHLPSASLTAVLLPYFDPIGHQRHGLPGALVPLPVLLDRLVLGVIGGQRGGQGEQQANPEGQE